MHNRLEDGAEEHDSQPDPESEFVDAVIEEGSDVPVLVDPEVVEGREGRDKDDIAEDRAHEGAIEE